MSEYAFKSAVELAQAIRSKAVSSLELTDMYIQRVETIDADINAVVVKDFERGRKAAKEADAALAKGLSLGPLHGVPMTIKEAYDIEGLPTTWGVPAFKNNIATTDADVVTRFKQAGAHFFGKTNVPLNLADFPEQTTPHACTRCGAGAGWSSSRRPCCTPRYAEWMETKRTSGVGIRWK